MTEFFTLKRKFGFLGLKSDIKTNEIKQILQTIKSLIIRWSIKTNVLIIFIDWISEVKIQELKLQMF